jgi:hypothetical protein
MQYLLLIHDNVTSPTTDSDWADFIARATESGMFRGGSELGSREIIGTGAALPSSAHIGGFMRFDADDRLRLVELLQSHPIVIHGGTVELCEMPQS